MRKLYVISFIIMLLCIACEWRLAPNGEDDTHRVVIDRYDRIESLYLTTSDFSALQKMNTEYPMQTRTLVEDVLKIGQVNDPEINTKFLHFYQDTVLQTLINEVEQQYASVSDLNKQLSEAFTYLQSKLPNFTIPEVYTQIGALDQSIIIGNNTLGISLDKYLGENYILYKKYYPLSQRKLMTRAYIVPDCVGFYLLSLYPMPMDRMLTQDENDMHMGKIQWVVNHTLKRTVFMNKFVQAVERYMKHHKDCSLDELLKNNDYDKIMQET